MNTHCTHSLQSKNTKRSVMLLPWKAPDRPYRHGYERIMIPYTDSEGRQKFHIQIVSLSKLEKLPEKKLF